MQELARLKAIGCTHIVYHNGQREGIFIFGDSELTAELHNISLNGFKVEGLVSV